MSKFWKSKTKAKCPFYLGERDRSIICESHTCENVRFTFESPQEKHKYQAKDGQIEGIWYNAKYNNNGGKTSLDASDDAATANWGGSWRMPTASEIEELYDECTWTWTTENEVNGYRVIGTNGNSIFLPAAGRRGGSNLNDEGNYGNYWSSSLDESNSGSGRFLYFNSGYVGTWDSSRRYVGFPVRPVCPSAE